MRTGNNYSGARWAFSTRPQSAARWPRSKMCLADGGIHRWKYAADRSSRECEKCGTFQRNEGTR